MKTFQLRRNYGKFVILFFYLSFGHTQSPGGINTDLKLWLKANYGVEEDISDSAEDSDDVKRWLDNTVNANHAIQITNSKRPTYYQGGINFNPIINFDGSNHELKSSIVANSVMTVFAITDGSNNSTKSLLHLDNGTNGSIEMKQLNSNTLEGRYTDSTGTSSGIVTNNITNVSSGIPYLVNYRHLENKKSRLFINGVLQSLPASNTNANTLSGTMDANIGSTPSDPTTRWQGDLSELIIYNHKISQSERQKIESYLAVKYGITLGVNGSSLDYIDSDGTVIWDVDTGNATDDAFNYNVTGIGRDDTSELEQKQSKSINTNDDLTIGIKTIETTNTQNTSEFFADKTFLMWGNNNGGTTPDSPITKDFGSGASSISSVTPISQKWKIVIKDSVPTVKLSIPESMVSSTNTGGPIYVMVVSDDANFSTNVTSVTMDNVGSELETEFYFEGTKYITFGSTSQVSLNNGRSAYFNNTGSTDTYLDAGNVNDLDNSDFTISAWIKRDIGQNKFDIVSKRNYFNENLPGGDTYTHGYAFRINQSNKFRMVWRNPSDTANSILQTKESIPENEWHHVAATYDFSENEAVLYIDGIPVYDSDDYLADKGVPLSPMTMPSDSHFIIGAAHHINRQQKMRGSIDEVRVWDVPLSANQIQYIMNQEIEQNISLNVDGKILPSETTKNDIDDIPWNNLIGYYPMSTLVFGSIKDESNSGNDASMINYSNLDEQTAPLPYKTTSGGTGNWDDSATWENGDVQYLPGVVSYLYEDEPNDSDKLTMDYNIVQINHDVTLDNTNSSLIPLYKDNNRTVLGLIINNNKKLTVNGDNGAQTGNGLIVSHYLELDGDIDLEGESQLIQTIDSDLVVGASGKLERDQQGTADTYTYNYWSSPVGTTDSGVTNHNYSISDVLKDEDLDINFTSSSYNGSSGTPITLADYWMWKFVNGDEGDYDAWQHVKSNGTINTGEGFTMKGPGSGAITEEQNYVFSGKPNNGDVDIAIGSGKNYLIGNPYPSAINAYEFINDNSASITGTLYFWEHWGGGSHVLREYQGGYHLLNLSGATTAATEGSNHPEVGTGGTPIKLPGNYIPVSQGFFVLGDEDGGTINFNNGQRIFHKESSGNSTFVEMNDEFSDSEITPNANNQANNVTTSEDTRLKIRIGFNSINTIRRQLLVTEDSNASSGIDWGYDGMMQETQLDDMFWLINDQRFAIQGTDLIDNQTILPIGVYTDSDGLNSFVLDALTNAPEETSVYLHDKILNIYHNLSEQNYDIFLPAGEYLERFEITFSNQNTLNITNKVLTDNVDVYYSNNIKSIVIVNPLYKDINALQVMNLLGQSIQNIKIVSNQNYQEIRLNELSSGAYIIKLNTSSGIASKKIIVK